MVSRNPRRGTSEQRRAQRKLEKMQQFSHSGFAGMSIIEMLEEALQKAAVSYVKIADHDPPLSGPEKSSARGQLRGIAMGIAMMRHPYRRYETVWWNYMKKLEKRAVAKARDVNNSAG